MNGVKNLINASSCFVGSYCDILGTPIMTIQSCMNYEMEGTILIKTVKENDLVVAMNANMKVSEQCRIARVTRFLE